MVNAFLEAALIVAAIARIKHPYIYALYEHIQVGRWRHKKRGAYLLRIALSSSLGFRNLSIILVCFLFLAKPAAAEQLLRGTRTKFDVYSECSDEGCEPRSGSNDSPLKSLAAACRRRPTQRVAINVAHAVNVDSALRAIDTC